MNEKSITNLLKKAGNDSFKIKQLENERDNDSFKIKQLENERDNDSFKIKQLENERDFYKHKSTMADIDTEYIHDMENSLIEASTYITHEDSIENVTEWKLKWLRHTDKLLKYKLLSI